MFQMHWMPASRQWTSQGGHYCHYSLLSQWVALGLTEIDRLDRIRPTAEKIDDGGGGGVGRGAYCMTLWIFTHRCGALVQRRRRMYPS
jgi:hypothetical protein